MTQVKSTVCPEGSGFFVYKKGGFIYNVINDCSKDIQK